MPGVRIVEHGFREFVRECYAAGPEAKAAVRHELQQVGELVAEEARSVAGEVGLAPPGRSGRGTGALAARIRPLVTGRSVFVRELASRQGYSYPALYEFQRGRPFLYPALERKQEEVLARFDLALSAVTALR